MEKFSLLVPDDYQQVVGPDLNPGSLTLQSGFEEGPPLVALAIEMLSHLPHLPLLSSQLWSVASVSLLFKYLPAFLGMGRVLTPSPHSAVPSPTLLSLCLSATVP